MTLQDRRVIYKHFFRTHVTCVLPLRFLLDGPSDFQEPALPNVRENGYPNLDDVSGKKARNCLSTIAFGYFRERPSAVRAKVKQVLGYE
jgi:hypothetical protein